MVMILPQGFCVFLFLLVSVEPRFFFGLAVTDRDVWSSILEKNMNVDGSSSSSSARRNLEVRFDGPAKHWTDALPIGNGRLGAMVWGGVLNETINLNEDTLWTGTPGDYTDPGALNILSEVRKLVDNGQYAEATLAAVNLSGDPSAVYQLLGDIKLEFNDSHATYDSESYERVLDLDTATVKVGYSASGIKYMREYFASSPDQVIMIRISTNKPSSLNFTASLDSKLHHHSYVNEKKQIILDGNCQGTRIAPHVYRKNSNNNDPKGRCVIEEVERSIHKGTQLSAVLDLQTSDVACDLHVVDNRKLRVEGCDWAVIRLTASSSFDGPFINPADSKMDPILESSTAMDSARKYSYSDLYARHVNDYQELFHRVSLQLDNNSSKSGMKNVVNLKECNNESITTAQRVKSFKTYEDPSLVELLFQYGRYLLIACSRPGTQPSNLQGIWNKDTEPPWEYVQKFPNILLHFSRYYYPSIFLLGFQQDRKQPSMSNTCMDVS